MESPAQIVEVRSRAIPSLVLHRIINWGDATDSTPTTSYERYDVTPEHERLQLALISMQQGKSFHPHVHVESADFIERGRAQESWVILAGRVRFTYFDVDGALLAHADLDAPAITLTHAGGHSYECLSEVARVAEFKSGPYQGRLKDKALIVGNLIAIEPGQDVLS